VKILCVDDQDGARGGLRRLLVAWGYAVVEASSGRECLEALRDSDPPRLVLLDWSMPGMDGVEVARTIRTDPDLPYVYIIFLTGHDDAADKVTALDSGADEFITKPFSPIELQSRVRVAERILARIPPGSASAPAIVGYRFGDLLGEGAFGVVYKAKQVGTDRTVAVKLLRAHLVGPSAREAFVREARIAAKFDHPGIVRIFDFRTQGDQDYCAMEFVDGPTLSRLLETHHLKRTEVLRLIVRICDAVGYAHRHGVTHRDLKPNNILIDPQGLPKVTDFGLAKMKMESSPELSTAPKSEGIAGTPAFMSPEQARGDNSSVGPTTDVYALGVMLYRMVVGRYPYGREDLSVPGLLAEISAGRIIPPSAVMQRVDPRLEAIILKALALEPNDRFQDADAMAAELRLYGRRGAAPEVLERLPNAPGEEPES